MTFRTPTILPPLSTPAGIEPPMARSLPRDRALQRLRFHTGRTLTASALEAEQAYVMARFGLQGRLLSPGVISGLGVVIGNQAETPGRLIIEAGRGLTRAGQDVVLSSPSTVDVNNLPVRGGAEAMGPARGLAVLVLIPVEAERVFFASAAEKEANFTATLPRDRRSAPYQDLRLLDGVLAVLVPLPDELVPVDAAQAVNLATDAMLTREVAGTDPWSGVGVPLALIRIDPDGRVAWLHRSAARRRGGVLPQPHRPGRSLPPALRQARLESLIEQWDAWLRQGWDGRDAGLRMRFLPPAGLLPKRAWDNSGFFPGGWRQAQAPIPLGQLEGVLDAAAVLAPYDLTRADDAVKWLIPVPAGVYDADLLNTDPQIDPVFAETRATLAQAVANARRLRDWRYRESVRAVEWLIDSTAARSLEPIQVDPEALEGEADFPITDESDLPSEPQTAAIAAHADFFAGIGANLLTDGQRTMIDPAGVGTDAFTGVRPFLAELRRLTGEADDVIDLGFARLQADIYRIRQIMLDNEEATKLATFPILAGLAKGSNAVATNAGLKAHFTAQKALRASQPGAAPPPAAGEATLRLHLIGQPLSVQPDDLGAAPVPGREPTVTRGTGGPSVSLLESTALTSFQTPKDSFTFDQIDGGAVLAAQMQPNAFRDLVNQIQQGAIDDLVLATAQDKRLGILGAQPLIGEIRDTRTMTIADRIAVSAAVTARSSALGIKAEILGQLQALGMNLTGVKAPLTSDSWRAAVLSLEDYQAVRTQLPTEELRAELDRFRVVLVNNEGGEQPAAAAEPTLVRIALDRLLPADGNAPLNPLQMAGEVLRRAYAPIHVTGLAGLTLGKVLDPEPDGADDEATFLASAVAILENTVGMLRAVERRVAAVRALADRTELLLPELGLALDRSLEALAAAERDLAEARHDLSVCDSLIEEETKRLAALGQRRRKILADHVTVVAYVRPRVLQPHRAATTSGRLLPGVFADPLPVCFKADVAPPQEIEDMLAALREAPIGWLSANPELLAVFRDPQLLERTYLKVVAGNRFRQEHATVRARAKDTVRESRGQQAARRIAAGYLTLVGRLRAARLSIEYTRFHSASWADRRRRALADMSLNDLIESGADVAVARRALDEIEAIERVATCLFQRVQQAPAPVRLIWARTLSSYDQVGSLEDITRLPGWNALPIPLRQAMQRLSGWLFGRVEPTPPEARAMISDLVRVALLMASHAPVADIISARLASEQTLQAGGVLDLVVRRGLPKIGMITKVYRAGVWQASGVIRDLKGDRARVELREVAGGLQALGPEARVTVHAAMARALTGF